MFRAARATGEDGMPRALAGPLRKFLTPALSGAFRKVTCSCGLLVFG